jgi:hypothetical protein
VNHVPSGDPAHPAPGIWSRRSLLLSAGAVGLSAMAAPALAAVVGTRRTSSPDQNPAGRRHLVLDYRPSQQTGWGEAYTPTIGGHARSAEFTYQGTAYQVSLVPSGHAGSSQDPVYENVPADPVVNFTSTLAAAWDACYSFRYQGGFRGRDEFTVESYSTFFQEPTQYNPGLSYGTDLYITYKPGPGDPPVRRRMYWIQVMNWPGGTGSSSSLVDNDGRANPFYGEAGGLTSISGNQSFSFYGTPKNTVMPGQGITAPDHFTAETFLAQHTTAKDPSGRNIVDIYSGVKWGWQIQPTG